MDKKIVSVTLGGQEVTVEVPVIEVEKDSLNRKGNVRYAELPHYLFREGRPPLSCRVGGLGIAVYCVLLVHQEWKTGIVQISKREIGRALNLSESQVYRGIRRLLEHRLIAKLPVIGAEGGRGKKAGYYLTQPIIRNPENPVNRTGFEEVGEDENPVIRTGFPQKNPGNRTGKPPETLPLGQGLTAKPCHGRAPYKEDEHKNTTTATRSSSFEKMIREESERVTNLFFAGAKDRPLRKIVEREFVLAWAAGILREYRLEDILRVCELARFAEHPAGLEKSIRAICKPRQQIEAARQAADEKARRDQEQRAQDRANALSLREGIRKYRPKFLDSAGAGESVSRQGAETQSEETQHEEHEGTRR